MNQVYNIDGQRLYFRVLMLIIGVDTSTLRASAALTKAGVVLCEVCPEPSSTHSRSLLKIIDNLLTSASLRLDDVDIFATARGPGSFTGLRIGIGSVFGLADALGKPALGASSLDARARAHTGWGMDYLCPVIPARADSVYTALYKMEGGAVTKVRDEMEITPEKLADMIDGPVCFVGEGYERHSDVLGAGTGYKARFAKTSAMTSAGGVALLVGETVEKQSMEGSVLAPVYISRSQAEINMEKLEVQL